MKLLMTLACIAGFNFGYAQNNTPNDWTSIENSTYKIKHPVNWTIDTSKLAGSEFFIFSPSDADDDQFRENINLITEDLHGQEIELDEYAELTVKQINKMLTDVKIYDSTIVKTGKSEYYKMIYEMTQGTFKLMIEQYLFIGNTKAFILTFAAEAKKFETYRSTAEQILNSFELTK